MRSLSNHVISFFCLMTLFLYLSVLVSLCHIFDPPSETICIIISKQPIRDSLFIYFWFTIVLKCVGCTVFIFRKFKMANFFTKRCTIAIEFSDSCRLSPINNQAADHNRSNGNQWVRDSCYMTFNYKINFIYFELYANPASPLPSKLRQNWTITIFPTISASQSSSSWCCVYRSIQKGFYTVR